MMPRCWSSLHTTDNPSQTLHSPARSSDLQAQSPASDAPDRQEALADVGAGGARGFRTTPYLRERARYGDSRTGAVSTCDPLFNERSTHRS
jgi:hypothetical protein